MELITHLALSEHMLMDGSSDGLECFSPIEWPNWVDHSQTKSFMTQWWANSKNSQAGNNTIL
jgi:hypothetical protein